MKNYFPFDKKINILFPMKYLIGIILLAICSEYKVQAAELTCPDGQYSVRGHYRKAYVKSDGTFVSSSQVKSHCKLLTRGYEFSKERFKKGRPAGWPHSIEKETKWSDSEKARIIEILEEIPDALLSEKISGFYRFIKSKDFPNPASGADGHIVLYDSAFGSDRSLGNILAHELSHTNYNDLTENERQDYRRATGWHLELESNGKVYWTGRKEGYIEEDGRNSHEEDYANNVEHFLYDPDKLKKVTPKAYDWIKKRFGETFRLKKGQK